MVHTLLSSVLVLTSLVQWGENIKLSAGPHYSHYLLYQDDQEAQGKWGIGGEIAVVNLIPNIGLKLRGTRLRYEDAENSYVYEYTPFSLCTSFNILPFLKLDWMRLSVETGFGLYFWRGLYNDEVIVLPTGEEMDERDLGFVAGLTLQVRPVRYIGVEYSTQYNYIASADIYKYGFLDKDDKIWEHGLGLKIIWP